LQSVEQPLGQTVQYRYDGRGRLARVVNARGHAIDQLYEPWGALEEVRHYPSEADAIAGTNLARTLAYGYDLEGSLTLTSDDDPALGVSGSLYTISHDLLGRVDLATAHYLPGGDRVLDSAYDRFGERRELKLIQGAETLTHSWSFDALGRLDLASFPKPEIEPILGILLQGALASASGAAPGTRYSS
jgi:YD repeat-containing protein